MSTLLVWTKVLVKGRDGPISRIQRDRTVGWVPAAFGSDDFGGVVHQPKPALPRRPCCSSPARYGVAAQQVAANDAAQQLDQLRQANASRAESDRLGQEALDERAAATVQALTGDLTARTGERDQLQTRLDEQTRELTTIPRAPARRDPPRR